MVGGWWSLGAGLKGGSQQKKIAVLKDSPGGKQQTVRCRSKDRLYEG